MAFLSLLQAAAMQNSTYEEETHAAPRNFCLPQPYQTLETSTLFLQDKPGDAGSSLMDTSLNDLNYLDSPLEALPQLTLGTTNGPPSNWDPSSLIVPSLNGTSETDSTSSPTSILSSEPTVKDFSPASSAYSQLSMDSCTSDKCQQLLAKNKELSRENKRLENTVRLSEKKNTSSEQEILRLKVENHTQTTIFNELLKKLDCLSSTATLAPANPIVTVYMAVDAYLLIDPNDVGDPRVLMFRESDWWKKAEKSRQILDFNGDENVGGPLTFLVDEDGMVVSVERQGDMRQKGRSMLMALKLANRCLTTWLKADDFATVFFCRSMCSSFNEFRLCEGDWKASQFAIKLLPQWDGRPKATRSDSIDIKIEPCVKVEAAMTPVPSSSTTKRPPSLTVIDSTIYTNKIWSATPVIHAPKPMPVVQDTSIRVNRSSIKISNPLLSRKNMPSQPSTQLPQLSPQLSQVDEPTLNILEPPVDAETTPLGILQQIASALAVPVAGPIIPAFIRTPTDNPMHTGLVGAPGIEIPNSKKKREVNLQSILCPSKSNTVRNLCAHAYKDENKGRNVTVGEFTAHWDSLSEDDRKPWNDKMMLVKMAQQAAFKNVAGPSDATPSN
ncbi:hypothetical protein DFH29DRAFT_1083954 [Suillus ampliporus]|nr:hypothetical protein DFH29DRAFT_1083954 [Suillus ampliporus]